MVFDFQGRVIRPKIILILHFSSQSLVVTPFMVINVQHKTGWSWIKLQRLTSHWMRTFLTNQRRLHDTVFGPHTSDLS